MESDLSSPPMIAEALACSADDACVAQTAGVQRLEICSAILVGGLTPSIGTFNAIRDVCSLQLMAMVRPRPSGFLYTALEFRAMLNDATALIDAGADGIVFGVLDDSAEIDVARCKLLVERAKGKQTVFHRAFDAVRDPQFALETLISLGVTRVLTSGQAPTALQGADLIRELIELADGRIEILVGGGVRPETVNEIVTRTGAKQVHLGPFLPQSDHSLDSSPTAASTYGGTYPVVDEQSLSRVVKNLKEFQATT